MFLMPCRLRWLELVYAGLKKTGVVLASFDGFDFLPFAPFDDIGIYVIIPKIASFFSCSLGLAVDIFFYGAIASSLLCALISFYYLYRSWACLLIAAFNLSLLAFFMIKIGDVYVIYFAAVIGIVPLAMYLVNQASLKVLVAFCLIIGALAMTCHYVRAYSSLAPLIFLLTLIALTKLYSVGYKCMLFGMILLGAAPVYGYFHHVQTHYHIFEQHHGKGIAKEYHHPFWHTIYVGFGFLNYLNEEAISFDDSIGVEHAQQIDPGCEYGTKNYEQVLKNKVVSLVKEKPKFVLYTLFAKLGVLFLLFLCFANSGLLFIFRYRLPLDLYCAFFLSFAFSMIFPIIALPNPVYGATFISLATVFGILHSCLAIKSYRYERTISSRMAH